ncbi:unnamed protein product [Paramecium sonneborni]|uniref:Uncharacterized protein n=1 Tax=Paramecium sonneborni TaxID=65129 RepID=A0A8S1R6N1_9CILI|nr:unnamed protein product [Paramecium sonneborni]
MSTLAAARADNFYFGPNYDPNGGSLKYQRKMKLKGKRKPSRLDQYKIKSGPKIRFETPFHVKCQKCDHMIAKGVRFNAAKREVGKFHSTTILQFSMLCPSCKNTIVCKTDPENCDYNYTEGAVKWLSTENATDMKFIPNPEQKIKEQSNAMYKLEVEVEKVKQNNLASVIEDLQKYRLENWKDDFEKNLMLRKKFREAKQQYAQIEAEQNKVKNFGLPMEELTKSELRDIKDLKFHESNSRKQQREKRQEIMNQSILPSGRMNSQQQKQLEELNKKLSQMPAATRKIFKQQLMPKKNSIKF